MKRVLFAAPALVALTAQAAPEPPPAVRRQMDALAQHAGNPIQETDLSYDTRVIRPAYSDRRPAVLFDAAHHNLHRPTTGYGPFANLISSDGYRITTNDRPFSAAALAGQDVLIIVNAAGSENLNAYWSSAFTEQECLAVAEWVRNGGSLLLIADHAPFGGASEQLARQFGVDMSKGVTADPDHFDPETGNLSFILYSRENRMLGIHPILEGRNATERINRVMTFSGQSLRGPDGSVSLLSLGEHARDRAQPTQAQIEAAVAAARESARREGRTGPLPVALNQGTSTSAAGRAQAVALRFGRGRVVVLGEAAMLTAQRTSTGVLFGMNHRGTDNRQFALNVMHWLSGLLD